MPKKKRKPTILTLTGKWFKEMLTVWCMLFGLLMVLHLFRLGSKTLIIESVSAEVAETPKLFFDYGKEE